MKREDLPVSPLETGALQQRRSQKKRAFLFCCSDTAAFHTRVQWGALASTGHTELLMLKKEEKRYTPCAAVANANVVEQLHTYTLFVTREGIKELSER